MPIGVYLSRCAGSLDGVVDLEAISTDLDGTADLVRVVEDFYAPEAMDVLLADIAEHGLDAVVLAGNSPERFLRSVAAGRLKERLVAAGVSPSRVTHANLLEQVARPHRGDPDAQAKALALVHVAMLEATASAPLDFEERAPRREVLVLGATSEGYIASLRLLEMGFGVVVADRGDEGERSRTTELAATRAYLMGHPDFRVVHDARVIDGLGWVGDFEVTLASAEGEVTVRPGGILFAEPHRTEWVEELRPHFRIDVDDEGRARSLDPDAHPAETVDPGIMVVPIRDAEAKHREKVAAADSAAMALLLALSRDATRHYLMTSRVDEALCGGCASCVKTCIFGACSLDERGVSQVDTRRCRGCGKCVVGCPVGARDVSISPHAYLVGAIHTLAAASMSRPKVLGFLCGGCGYPAADDASGAEGSYPASFLPLRIPCGGRLDAIYVLEAFRRGFDGVTVFRCREGHCNNLIGNLDMDRRLSLLRTVLRSRGIDDSRLRIVDISPGEGDVFTESVNGVYETLNALAAGKEAAR